MIAVQFSPGMLPGNLLDTWHERAQQHNEAGNFDQAGCVAEEACWSAEQVLAKIGGTLPDIVVLIGIGGSSLGTQAIYGALAHTLPETSPELWIVDTIDPVTTSTWLTKFHRACHHNKRIVLVVVSKSGTTLETSANAALFIPLLQDHVRKIIISHEGSPLHAHAQAHGWLFAPFPVNLGGRFSVFSHAAMIPLALLGFDIKALLRGAQMARETGHLRADLVSLSAFLAAGYACGFVIHDMFVSAPHLFGIGAWYRQLCAESLGKQMPDGTRVGLVPTVSCISSDLHSIAQLYLAGPRRSMTTFLEGLDQGPEVTVPGSNGSSVRTIHAALCSGIRIAYAEAKLPYVHITYHTAQSEAVGFLLQYHMMVIIIVAGMWNINPFDQPQVEDYKKWVREVLR